jgi:hypothetical protein
VDAAPVELDSIVDSYVDELGAWLVEAAPVELASGVVSYVDELCPWVVDVAAPVVLVSSVLGIFDSLVCLEVELEN